MPWALIEVRREWSPEQENAIIDAVHGALVTAFQIPPKDKHVRLQVHEPHRFAHPPTLTQPEYATLVSVDCFAGRSVEAKRRLYSEIVDRLEPLGIPRDHVSISLRESPSDRAQRRGPLHITGHPGETTARRADSARHAAKMASAGSSAVSASTVPAQ